MGLLGRKKKDGHAGAQQANAADAAVDLDHDGSHREIDDYWAQIGDVDDDEPQRPEGREDGGPRPDDNVDVSAPDAVPLVVPLTLRQGRVLDGDALTEGEVAIFVRDVRNGFTGRASAVISRDGEEVSVNAYIYDAWGTVSGTV